MKLGAAVAAVLALFLMTSWLVTVAFGLMNRPNTMAVAIGIVILLGITAFYVAFGQRVYRGIRDAIRARRERGQGVTRTLTLLLIATTAISISTGCTRIGVGHVGIVTSLAGDDRGVQDITLETGWVFYNPMGTAVYEYPVFVQTAVWTKNPEEGRPVNEEITFTTKDSMAVSADISIGYQLVQERVPAFYVKFRSDDLENFTHGFLRNLARDQFNEAAGKYSVEEVMGDNEPFITQVRARLQKLLDPVGVSIEQFGFIGAPRPPEAVIKSINDKVGAVQLALQKQNEILQFEADAKKSVAKARGEAESNRVLAASITPQLMQWRQLAITEQAIARWDGRRPMVEGQGSGLLLQIPMDGKLTEAAKSK